MRRRPAAVLGVAVLVAVAGLGAGRAGAVERVPAVLHVHTALTTGDFPLEDLVVEAERQGIGALLLAENYLLRIEYGLPPFRALTRVAWEERSVLAGGVERYQALVAEARRRHPGVLILPGVEVVPHYYWTREPLGLDLELRDTQKNLLVFGLSDPAALASLPAAGNRSRGGRTWRSAVEAAPGLLVPVGLGALLTRRVRRRRIGPAIVVVRRRRWFAGLLLVAIGATALVRGWPFRDDPYPPWEPAGLVPHQELIDHVERLGGTAVWSFPEAPDAGERRYGPVRVTWRTDPHPDDLLKTFRYSGFGALYEQPTHATDPGGVWDRLLAQYAAGERSRPAWALGESGFHDLGAGKRLHTVQTVFLVDERTEAGVLDALRRGRLYALVRTSAAGLVLSELTVAVTTAGASDARPPAAAAGPGETLGLVAGERLALRVAIDAADGGVEPVRVMLVRNGVVEEAWTGATPFRAVYRETFDGAPLVLRVDARGRAPQRLLTSPVFVRASR